MSHDAFAPDTPADDLPFLAPPAVSRAGRMPPPLDRAATLPPPFVTGAAGPARAWSVEPALETANGEAAGPPPDGSWLEALDQDAGTRPAPRSELETVEEPVFELEAEQGPAASTEPDSTVESEAQAAASDAAAAAAGPAEAAASVAAGSGADLPPWMAWIDDSANDEPAGSDVAADDAMDDGAVMDVADLLATEHDATDADTAVAPLSAAGDDEDEDPLPVQDIEALLFEPEPTPAALPHLDAEPGPAEPREPQWAPAQPELQAEPTPADTPEPVDQADGSGTAVPAAGTYDAPATEEVTENFGEQPAEEPADEPAAAPAAAAEAVFGSVVASSGALPDAFSGVFHEVADRLDNIADSLRRQSRGEGTAAGRNSDPLELLLTGFVLGYIAREGKGPQRPSGGA